MADYTNYEGNGIFISWQPISTDLSAIDHCSIKRSGYQNGTYEEITTIDFPQDYYVDGDGSLDSYYIIEERNASDIVLATHHPLWGDELMLRSSVAYELSWLLNVPVYQERLSFANDQRTKAKITAWGSINYWPRPKVYITGTQNDGDREPYILIPQKGATNIDTQIDFADDGVTWADTQTPDYDELEWYPDYNGYIYFVDTDGNPVSIKRADEVLIDYTFKAVSTTEINNAIYTTACDITAQAGVDKSYSANPGTIGNIPRYWDAALVDGAAYRILRRMALSLNQTERKLPFRDWSSDGDDPARRMLEMAKEYGEKFALEKKEIATAKYPNIRIIVGQEMQMPGARNRFFRMSFAATQ